MASVEITHVGGSTALIAIDGLRPLTDPALDTPGEYPADAREPVRTAGPVRVPQRHPGRLPASKPQ
jgi:L-ascorbate metabolism protein UlaG (beta-lactamase superfamily)